jgi:phosphoglycolate phosphatase-like HAD superfamily hydrolase
MSMLLPIVALDFDGVICDSARETAVSAWRAGRELWPEWDAAEPPPELVARFLRVRPYLDTGYQAILMMRLLADGLPDREFAERLEEHCRTWLERLGLGRDDLVRAFGRTRDEWIRADLAGWLGCHALYAGVSEALVQARSCVELYIVTTKQERFTRALLAAHGIALPAERLLGLERGRPKEDILSEILAGAGCRPLHFVEDRAETLRRVLAEPRLAAVHLYYAAWGYGTSADLAWARSEPRVRVWSLAEFLKLE